MILDNNSLVLKRHQLSIYKVCYGLITVFTFFVISLFRGARIFIFSTYLLYGMPPDQLQEYSLTSDYPHRSVNHNLLNLVIGQFSDQNNGPQYKALGNNYDNYGVCGVYYPEPHAQV